MTNEQALFIAIGTEPTADRAAARELLFCRLGLTIGTDGTGVVLDLPLADDED